MQKNKEEEAHLRRIFEKIDKNGDGVITADEMREFSHGVFENQFEVNFHRKAHWKEIFSIMDQNNDG